MPKRHSRLYQRINNSPATLLESGGITQIKAAFHWQFKSHLRRGYRIIDDSGEHFTVQRGDETTETWIESDPVQHRAPGGGPKPLASEEPTVKVTVTLLASQAEKLKQFGQGNLSRGIRRMYTMTTATTAQLTTGTISTKPERDPYANIDGVVSKTVLKLDPRDMTVWVEQEYNDNATPSDEWHELVPTWAVPNHPLEKSMRRWIEENMDRLMAICDGYESVWDGSNHVGRLTDKAWAIQEDIESELDNDGGPAEYYQWWTMESWLESSLDDINADMTDEELSKFAEGCEPGPGEVVFGYILEYITEHRDNLRADEE